jgi:outer membrane protein
MKRQILGWMAAVAMFSVGVARAEAPAQKIGLVEMQRALQSVEAGQKAKTSLEKEFNAKKAELQKKEADFKKDAEEFKKQAVVMNDEARAKKENELRERLMKLQENMQKAQADIQQKEQALTKPLVEKLRAIITEMAKARGYTMVLEKNEATVIFSQESDDLTKDVIAEFNKKNKG